MVPRLSRLAQLATRGHLVRVRVRARVRARVRVWVRVRVRVRATYSEARVSKRRKAKLAR